MGNCPCPRCLIPKLSKHLLGTQDDWEQRKTLRRVDDSSHKKTISSARKHIYQKQRPVDSVLVQRLLKPQSLVPTNVVPLLSFFGATYLIRAVQNAFSEKLSRFGFNLFSIFLVDFMHEIELGIWKKIFIHLLRNLDCIDGAVNTLDQR